VNIVPTSSSIRLPLTIQMLEKI